MKEMIFPVIAKEELRVDPSAILFLPKDENDFLANTKQKFQQLVQYI